MARILITGGTGFLGRRLGKRFREQGHEVLLTGRNNKLILFAEEFAGCRAAAMDVCRIEAVRDTFAEFKPDTVIHAAATKFVDRAEHYPMEAVDVNVVGSQNVARAAIDAGVRLVIGISTDKAAPPVRNTYGLTKALMERLFCSLDGKTDTHFLCVRYGNVAWSTGSVLCIWKKMLEANGVIETTGPEMTRFFFTVDEAVGLVRTAYEHSDELYGQVLSRHMKSAKLEDILKIWTARANGEYRRIEGRPGERNLEYLIGDLELPYTITRDYGGIQHFVIRFNRKAEQPLAEGLSSENTERLSEDEILAIVNNPPVEGMGQAG